MTDGTEPNSNPLARRVKYSMQGVKLALDRAISKTGYRVVRTAHLDVMKLDTALKRIFARPQTINTVIDIGASNGSLSKLVQQFLPSASFMLVEANDVHEANLRAYKASDARVDYVIAAAADEVGEINFDAEDPFGGLASHRDIDEYRATNVQSRRPDAGRQRPG